MSVTMKKPDAGSDAGRQDKPPWYDPGLSFKCTQCGNCCSGPAGVVWFTPEEGRKMAEHLGLPEAEFLRTYAEKRYGKWTLKEVVHPDRGYDCIFLRFERKTKKALCSIYPARPTQCWTWPWWPSILKSRKSWDAAAKTCPGIRKGGDFYPVEQIRVILGKNNDAL
jgi:Fe-S-cluster containining protein